MAVDLALQGGGSHGAFTWGVLDRLLEDETLGLDGVSGTSAGALNAAVMATGLAEGGRAGARAALRAFWLDVATGGECFGCTGAAAAPHAQAGWPGWPGWPMLPAARLEWSPAYQWFNLQTAVGRARVGRDAVRWQGVTTLRAHAREEEQRGQRTAARLNRVRSALTQGVKGVVGAKLNVHAVLPAEESGQLRFVGSRS